MSEIVMGTGNVPICIYAIIFIINNNKKHLKYIRLLFVISLSGIVPFNFQKTPTEILLLVPFRDGQTETKAQKLSQCL